MADDKIALETFYILSFGCEYVGELAELPEQMLCNCLELVEKLILIFQKALDRGTALPDLNPRDAAMSTYNVPAWPAENVHHQCFSATDRHGLQKSE